MVSFCWPTECVRHWTGMVSWGSIGLMSVLLALPLSEIGRIFFILVNAVFGWMPCHNLLPKKKNGTYLFTYLALSCKCCFAVMAASLFLNFCFYSSQCSINVKLDHIKRKKKTKKNLRNKKLSLLFLLDHSLCICCCFAMVILHSS